MNIILATLLLAISASTANAQVNKCVHPKTKVISYTDTLCDTSQASTLLEQRKSSDEIMSERIQAAEINERKQRERLNEVQQQQVQRVPIRQTRIDKSDTYECRIALKNHETTSSISSGTAEQRRNAINASTMKVNSICGTNTELMQAPVKKTIVNTEPDPEPPRRELNSRPSITDCSGGTCRDRDNNRYTVTDQNNLKREDGANCQYSGGAWNCR